MTEPTETSEPAGIDLDAAILAARRNADDAATSGVATRLRIRESLAARRGVRKRTTIIAAIVASLFGSTAFAYLSGWRPPWSEPPAPTAPALAVAPAPTTPHVAPRPARPVAPSVAPPIEVAPVAPVAPPVDVAVVALLPAIASAPPVAPPEVAVVVPPVAPPAIASVPRTRTVPRQPAPVEAPPSPPAHVEVAPARIESPPIAVVPAPDPQLAAYRVAHQVHFRGTDARAALAAWDAYLASYPTGSLAPDARYSRALVLIKLARYADARAALRPFADAPAGTYRQAEAAKLLAALP